jgi:hypothetical protein
MEFGDTARLTTLRTAFLPPSGTVQYLDTAKDALLLITAPAEQPDSVIATSIKIKLPSFIVSSSKQS